MVGYAVENFKSNAQGMVDVAALAAQMNEDVAALMLTNPNTLGVFEQEIHKIAEIMHAKGGLLYMDGANMNALVGKVRPGDFGVDVMHLNLHKTFSTPHGGGGPGSGPVAVKKNLEPFLPTPVAVTKADGTLGVRIQPPAIRRPGARVLRKLRNVRARPGLHPGQRPRRPAPDHRRRSAQRQLHSQGARRRITTCPTHTPSMHEVVFSDKLQAKKGVKTMDIAKRLIDYGFHPYTTAFPLIVPGALMIEPTESESKEELDLFIEAMKSIAEEVEEDPQTVLDAPHSTRVSRLDETAAARKPVLRWKPAVLTTEDTEDTEGSSPWTMRRIPSRRCTTLKFINRPTYFPLSFKKGNKLCQVNRRNSVHRLDFDHHSILHKNVQPETQINPLAVVVHRKRKLRGSPKSTLSQFVDQASLINALQ